MGTRSFGPVRVGLKAGLDYYKAANEEVSIGMIETKEALDNLDEIQAERWIGRSKCERRFHVAPFAHGCAGLAVQMRTRFDMGSWEGLSGVVANGADWRVLKNQLTSGTAKFFRAVKD
ncbi:MAG: hypothetical protein CMO80_12235 [Verrucomicrobiales bacterium]|nr:hypothetical protein [Verrucomicrobiales bacterium]|tara:strand:- start:3410 stop:3763 length:354 start_codon:yes stop_codon:yes gene_type:complete